MIPVLQDLKSGKKPFFLAPLAELTHLPLRLLIEEWGGCGYYFTEMISAGALVSHTPYEKFYAEAGPLADRTVFQLAGSDPDVICSGAEFLTGRPGAGIDINMGCSAYTMIQKGWGICWMKDSRRAHELIKALRPVVRGRSLSVKMRIGWNPDVSALKEFAQALVEGGVDFLILNPQLKKDNRDRPGDWSWVRKLKESVSVPVVGNGNITDRNSFAYRAGFNGFDGFGADGYMIGRGAVSRPWIFRDLSRMVTGEKDPIRIDLQKTLIRFDELLCLYQPQEFRSSRISRFLFYYCRNFRFGHRLFAVIRNCGKDADAMIRTVCEYLERHPEERFLII